MRIGRIGNNYTNMSQSRALRSQVGTTIPEHGAGQLCIISDNHTERDCLEDQSLDRMNDIGTVSESPSQSLNQNLSLSLRHAVSYILNYLSSQ
jgi:hypothetical protein